MTYADNTPTRFLNGSFQSCVLCARSSSRASGRYRSSHLTVVSNGEEVKEEEEEEKPYRRVHKMVSKTAPKKKKKKKKKKR